MVVLALMAPVAFARQRAVAHPFTPPPDPAVWVRANAIPLATTEPLAPLDDLAPMQSLIGDAHVVGLGDGTHGTHEYFQTKVRMIRYLVEQMNFTGVALEAPFADFGQLNTYILGGSGDPRRILLTHRELNYWFWACEELVQLIEWMRQYNMTRGARSAVEIVGIDVYDPDGAAAIAISYLQRVDPSAASAASTTYSRCVVRMTVPGSTCPSELAAVANNITAHPEWIATTGATDYYDAQHAAHLVDVYQATFNGRPSFAERDQRMAEYVSFAIDHHTSNGRLALWMHQEHAGRTTKNIQGSRSTGSWLGERYGNDYFVFGNATGNGTYLGADLTKGANVTTTYALPSAKSDSFESIFEAAGIPRMIVPLRGSVPDSLRASHPYRFGTSAQPYEIEEPMTPKFDAVVWIESTTPTITFW